MSDDGLLGRAELELTFHSADARLTDDAQPVAKRQSRLKVAPVVDEMISRGAHFMGVTKKDLVAAAVRDYLAVRREEIHCAMGEAMRVLNGTTTSRVALLTDVTRQDIDRLGGIGE